MIVRLTLLSNIPFLTELEKTNILTRERTYKLANERRFESKQYFLHSSAVQAAYYCRKNTLQL